MRELFENLNSEKYERCSCGEKAMSGSIPTMPVMPNTEDDYIQLMPITGGTMMMPNVQATGGAMTTPSMQVTGGAMTTPSMQVTGGANMTPSIPSNGGNMIPGMSMGDSSCNQWVIDRVGLAQAYVPYQNTFNTMSEDKSLACGTIFSELVQPYKKGSGLKNS